VRRGRRSNGFSLVDVIFTLGLAATLGGVAAAPLLNALEEFRTLGAVRHVAARLQRARMEAIVRSADVAIRFAVSGAVYTYALYVDGNGDGVLARDIQAGVDVRLGSLERLSDEFAGVDFGALPGLPSVDPGGTPPGSDPVRLGASDSATFTAAGTASSGSLYLLGPHRRQFVIRIYGDTGRTRVLRFDSSTRSWRPL
jgi:hypothetical protein